jgi:hypothetical protein
VSNDSILVRQERCPLCAKEGRDRSGNNLAVYSDGHTYCYGGHGLLDGGSKVLQFLSSPIPVDKHEVYLPEDCDVEYPERCLAWVGQYELTEHDLLSNDVVWSEQWQRLIFPIYGAEKNLIAWQGRWFGEEDRTKWFGLGNLKDTYNVLGNGKDNILILTEDIISAIKVGNSGFLAMPLYGCVVGADRFRRLQKLFPYVTTIYVWLDPDKRKEAVKEARLGTLYGFRSSTIFSEKDPKEMSYEQIKTILL